MSVLCISYCCHVIHYVTSGVSRGVWHGNNTPHRIYASFEVVYDMVWCTSAVEHDMVWCGVWHSVWQQRCCCYVVWDMMYDIVYDCVVYDMVYDIHYVVYDMVYDYMVYDMVYDIHCHIATTLLLSCDTPHSHTPCHTPHSGVWHGVAYDMVYGSSGVVAMTWCMTMWCMTWCLT